MSFVPFSLYQDIDVAIRVFCARYIATINAYAGFNRPSEDAALGAILQEPFYLRLIYCRLNSHGATDLRAAKDARTLLR